MSTLNLSIRDATLSDYDGISKLHRQIHELHVMNRPDLYQSVQNTLDFDYYQTLLNDENCRVLVAEHQGVVAYTIIRVHDIPNIPIFVPRRTLHIDDICVDETFRGNGIGTAIFQHVKAYAKSIGAVSLELNVLAFNQDAIEFYRKLKMTSKSIRMELDSDHTSESAVLKPSAVNFLFRTEGRSVARPAVQPDTDHNLKEKANEKA